MKRFYSAIAVLIFIILSSIFINNKIVQKTEELLQIAESNNAQAILSWWEDNDIWFEALLPGELNNSVRTNIMLLEENQNSSVIRDNIKAGAKKILESSEFSIKNIF